MECIKESYSKQVLAMAYVPWQKFDNVMDAGNGLAHGTIFKDLVLPFYGTKAACSNCNTCNGRRGGMR